MNSVNISRNLGVILMEQIVMVTLKYYIVYLERALLMLQYIVYENKILLQEFVELNAFCVVLPVVIFDVFILLVVVLVVFVLFVVFVVVVVPVVIIGVYGFMIYVLFTMLTQSELLFA